MQIFENFLGFQINKKIIAKNRYRERHFHPTKTNDVIVMAASRSKRTLSTSATDASSLAESSKFVNFIRSRQFAS